MIPPRKLKYWVTKKWKENIDFRTFLKCNADEEELDRQFLKLHQELFAGYDCSKCRNCCKKYYGTIPKTDIEKDAAYLKISPEEFMSRYLVIKEIEGEYQTKNKPCDFLEADGTCSLGECRPENCKKFPYTDQPERLYSLYSVLDAIEVCPVAFEIWERLKEIYGFHKVSNRRCDDV